MRSLIPVLLLFMCACLRAPHDHPFDPENPDKAYIGGTVYKYDGTIISNVDVKLYYPDTVVYDEIPSDNNGDYYFEDVDPGFYMLIAKYGYYAPVEIIPCSLEAGSYNDTADLWFGHMYFPFEEENVGTIAPRAFSVIQGNWAIVNDQSDPDKHTVPRIYHGNTPDTLVGIALVDEWMKDFSVDVKIKIMDMPAETWGAGLLLRYQNMQNFYGVQLNWNRVALVRMHQGMMMPLAVDSAFTTIPNEWYCVSAYCCHESLYLYIDGERLLSAADNTFSEGNFGLWVTNNDVSGTTIFFDDIDICP